MSASVALPALLLAVLLAPATAQSLRGPPNDQSSADDLFGEERARLLVSTQLRQLQQRRTLTSIEQVVSADSAALKRLLESKERMDPTVEVDAPSSVLLSMEEVAAGQVSSASGSTGSTGASGPTGAAMSLFATLARNAPEGTNHLLVAEPQAELEARGFAPQRWFRFETGDKDAGTSEFAEIVGVTGNSIELSERTQNWHFSGEQIQLLPADSPEPPHGPLAEWEEKLVGTAWNEKQLRDGRLEQLQYPKPGAQGGTGGKGVRPPIANGVLHEYVDHAQELQDKFADHVGNRKAELRDSVWQESWFQTHHLEERQQLQQESAAALEHAKEVLKAHGPEALMKENGIEYAKDSSGKTWSGTGGTGGTGASGPTGPGNDAATKSNGFLAILKDRHDEATEALAKAEVQARDHGTNIMRTSAAARQAKAEHQRMLWYEQTVHKMKHDADRAHAEALAGAEEVMRGEAERQATLDALNAPKQPKPTPPSWTMEQSCVCLAAVEERDTELSWLDCHLPGTKPPQQWSLLRTREACLAEALPKLWADGSADDRKSHAAAIQRALDASSGKAQAEADAGPVDDTQDYGVCKMETLRGALLTTQLHAQCTPILERHAEWFAKQPSAEPHKPSAHQVEKAKEFAQAQVLKAFAASRSHEEAVKRYGSGWGSAEGARPSWAVRDEPKGDERCGMTIGYKWCEEKGRCIRPWDEVCSDKPDAQEAQKEQLADSGNGDRLQTGMFGDGTVPFDASKGI